MTDLRLVKRGLIPAKAVLEQAGPGTINKAGDEHGKDKDKAKIRDFLDG